MLDERRHRKVLRMALLASDAARPNVRGRARVRRVNSIPRRRQAEFMVASDDDFYFLS